MADIAVGDVTYSVLQRRTLANSKNSNLVQLSFGNAALTYPAGGIPLSKANLGCPVIVESLSIVAQGTSGYKFQYDRANSKLVMMQSPAVAGAHTHTIPAHGHTLHLNNADVADGATTRVNAGTNLLGANTGTDIEIAGVADATGAGGIINAAAGTSGSSPATQAASALTEPSAVAIAAQVIEVEVIGW